MVKPSRNPVHRPAPGRDAGAGAGAKIGLGGARGARAKIRLGGSRGGPLGAIYEIGALCALEEALPGLDLNALDGYVGLSAGGFVAAGLANGMTPRQLCRAFIENEGPGDDIVRPTLFVRPALAEYTHRLASLPGLRAMAGFGFAFKGRSLPESLEHLGRALPTGVFSNAPLERQMRSLLGAPGRSNDFRQLLRERGRRLVLVATDLGSGEAAPFSLPGRDHVPISEAVAASAALPGLFPPVPIDGRRYVDGALKKTLHARVLLDLGLDLVLCLNPLVPFDASHALGHPALGADERIPRLVDGGLPVVLSQTFRTPIHSRLQMGMRGCLTSHPKTDIVLLEPDHRDPALFLAETFGYSQRRPLAEHAYQHTRADLRLRRGVRVEMLARHGLALDEAVLDQPRRTLLKHRRLPKGTRAVRALQRLDEVLDDLQLSLAARA